MNCAAVLMPEAEILNNFSLDRAAHFLPYSCVVTSSGLRGGGWIPMYTSTNLSSTGPCRNIHVHAHSSIGPCLIGEVS